MANRIELALGQWMRRLGVVQPEQPDILYSVQPVIVVANHENLTPRVQGPSILLGGNSPPGLATDHTVMTWHSTAPGGMLITVKLTTSGGSIFGIETGEPTWSTLGPVAMDLDMIGQPTPVTVGFMGTVTPANRRLTPIEIYPYLTGTLSNLTEIVTKFYIPNGRWFLHEAIAPNVPTSGWAEIEELPAPRTP